MRIAVVNLAQPLTALRKLTMSGDQATVRNKHRHETQAQALWNKHPNCTINQVIAILGNEHPVGYVRAVAHLRAVRTAAARKSSAQKQIRWRLDRWTATRIPIGEILKRHPEFIGRRVLEELGPEYSVLI
jgi:hypothetical protein